MIPELSDESVARPKSALQSTSLGQCGRASGRNAGLQNEKTVLVSESRACDESNSQHNIDNAPVPCRIRQLRAIWIPYLAVVSPNLVLPAALILLVFANRIDPGTNLFSKGGTPTSRHRGYYLVAFSITRLTFISSCLSTLAPFLTAPIMLLWRIHTIRSAQKTSVFGGNGRLKIASLPQLSRLLGLLIGSLEDVMDYLRQCCSRLFSRPSSRSQTSPISRQVHLAALIAGSSITMVLLIWTADTIFHTLSNSANIQKFGTTMSEMQSFGHVLTARCQNFDRSDNLCLPCTLDLSDNMSLLEYYTRANEIFRLRTNVSETSQIQSIAPGVSILLPRSIKVSNGTDYRARTIGVSAKCQPITKNCNIRVLEDASYTMFNCSNDFRGIIGMDPIQPIDQNFTTKDPNTPPLNFKPSAYLQLGFYEDSNLSEPYNSVNYNISTKGWAILEGASSTTPCPNDDALPMTTHMGVAGRFSASSAKAGVDLSNDPGLFTQPIYSEFVFDCALEAHEVEYLWASGAIHAYNMTPGKPSLLNMYIGQLSYYEQAASDDMTTDILQMALQQDSERMADMWAELYSTRILSVIGGYSLATLNLEQQTRTEILVAKVHIGSMWFLVGCSVNSALFVSWIALRGLMIVKADPDIFAQAEKLSFNVQLNECLGGESNCSGSHAHANSSPEIAAAEDFTKNGHPERSFTGNSSTSTVVPDPPEP